MYTVVRSLLGLFYIHNATETYREPLHPVPGYVQQAFPYFAAMIGVEWCVLVIGKGQRAVSVSDGLCSIIQGLQGQLLLAPARLIQATAYVYVWSEWRLCSVPHDNLLGFCTAMLTVDLAYYCFHRASHQCTLLWAAHQVHHSSEYYNLTTALRQPLLLPFVSWSFYLPVAVLGVAPSMFFTHAQFNTVYQFWIHTEAVGSLGPLELVLNTPSHHRVHHARDPSYLDKNFAGVLIVWDRMFGTFCAEKHAPSYGLTRAVRSYNTGHLQFRPLWCVLQQTRRQPDMIGKLRRLFCAPGSSPAPSDTSHDSREVSATHTRQPRFERSLHPITQYLTPIPDGWLQVYVGAHLTLVLLVATTGDLQCLTPAWPLFRCLVLTVSLACLSWLLDAAPGAIRAEIARCAVLLCGTLLQDPPLQTITQFLHVAIETLFALSLLLWAIVYCRKVCVSTSTQRHLVDVCSNSRKK